MLDTVEETRFKAISTDYACRKCGSNGFLRNEELIKLNAPAGCPDCGHEHVDQGVMIYIQVPNKKGDLAPLYCCDAHGGLVNACKCLVFFRTDRPDVFSCKICRQKVKIRSVNDV